MARADHDRRVDYVEFGATDLEPTRLDEVEGKIRSEGGRIVRETYEFPGGRRFHLTDPSGNELAVWPDR